jgi:hypothetical protein
LKRLGTLASRPISGNFETEPASSLNRTRRSRTTHSRQGRVCSSISRRAWEEIGLAQYAEPSVSVAKFGEEVEAFQALRADYEKRGWFLVEAAFPEIFVVMAASQVRPAPLVFGVLFDYTNYDFAPPSVRLADPFTRQPYVAKELPSTLNRALPPQTVALQGVPGNLQIVAPQPLMQAQTPEDIPFLCIAGVREYHDHPGHSGDTWELHRADGAGRLVRLLEVIHRYGVEPIRGFGVNLVPQVGLDYGEPPA